MFLLTGDVKYYDIIERTLYNAVIAGISLDGSDVYIRQETVYPWEGNIKIYINPSTERYFTVKLRVPGWIRNEPVPGNLYSYPDSEKGKISFKINGNEEKPLYSNGDIEISRNWEREDVLEVDFPMEVRRVISHENVKDNHNLQAVEYGPVVYCAEEVDNPGDFLKLSIPPDAQFMIEEREDLLNGINVITISSNNKTYGKGSKLVLVPYYSWSNRGIGKMKVWIPDK
jgi:DUF1680 family protein